MYLIWSTNVVYIISLYLYYLKMKYELLSGNTCKRENWPLTLIIIIVRMTVKVISMIY